MDEAKKERPCILIAYKGGTLYLTEFDGRLNEIQKIQDVKLHR